MKKILFPLLISLSICALQGCKNPGKEKVYNGVGLYHTSDITDAQADSLGKFLVSSHFANGQEKTVRLSKTGNTYHFRFIVKDGLDKDSTIDKPTRFYASILSSEVFNSSPVVIEMCDEAMKPLKAFPSVELGKKQNFNGVQLFHTAAVASAQADSMGKFLIRSGFASGKPITAQLAKSAGVFQFRITVSPGSESDAAYIKNVEVFGASISSGVFGGAPVEIDLCDEYLNTILAVPMGKTSRQK